MSVLESVSAGFSDVDKIGLAIRSTGIGYHSGILYLAQGQPRLLHLAFHYDLRDESPTHPYRWCQISLDEINKAVIAALVSRIANVKPGIPYGFNSDGVVFDDHGDLLDYPAGRGLTCATFILAVFRTYGFHIIDDDAWSDESEDDEWRELILSMLEGRATLEHIEAIKNDRHASRFKPEEVVGASSADPWPVGVADARELADRVRADLAA